MTTKATRDVIDLALRPVINCDINGGTIDGTTIGATTPAAATITNLTVTGTCVGTTAYYADYAEWYAADADYPPGTVLMIGGSEELTQTVSKACRGDVAGVVSTSPAHIINGDPAWLEQQKYPVMLGLLGRVPCRVIGRVKKGQRIVASEVPGVGMAATIWDTNLSHVVPAFGRALVDDDRDEERLVLIKLTPIA